MGVKHGQSKRLTERTIAKGLMFFPLANSKWLVKNYTSHFKDGDKWDVNKFMEKVKEDYVIDVSWLKAYRTHKDAQEQIEGTYHKQYALLWDYAEEIKCSNVGSTVEFQCDHAAMVLQSSRDYILHMMGAKQHSIRGVEIWLGWTVIIWKGRTQDNFSML